MPYISKERRVTLWDRSNQEYAASTAGELNFALSQVVSSYLGPRASYQEFNDVVGALECLKLEVYRRLVAPYEDRKLEENGDVFA